MSIDINVSTPIIVVNIPIFFDFVQPDKEIIINKEMIPNRNEKKPITLVGVKSSLITSVGYPCVVIIRIFVMAKRVIRKKHAAKIDAPIILLVNLDFVSDTKKFAIIAIENPPSNEVIVII
jgi:hypothetical protein